MKSSLLLLYLFTVLCTLQLEFHEIPPGAASGIDNYVPFSLKRFALDVGTGKKAKSAQNAGSKEMKDSSPSAGATVTLLTAVRVPSAAQSISYEPQVQNGNTVSQKLAIVFSGCSQTDHRTISQYGLDCEDQLRIMSLPVLRAFAPKITENIISVKAMGNDLFAPRCILPIQCKLGGSDVQGKKGKDSKPVESRPSRTLTYVALSSNDADASRDSFVRSAIASQAVTATEESITQRQMRALAAAAGIPTSFGFTAIPLRDDVSGKRVIVDLSGHGRVAATRSVMSRILRSRRASATFSSTSCPYAALYLPLWEAQALFADVEPLSDPLTSEPVNLSPSRSLSIVPSSSTAFVPAAGTNIIASRRLDSFSLGDLAPQGESGGCLSGSIKITEQTRNLWKYESVIIVVIIPVMYGISLDADFRCVFIILLL